MQQNALKELTKRLDTIKEVWQIYAIFEEEKKKFNEELEELKKDKEKLIESFNETSAKNAMLLAQNAELEAANSALEAKKIALEESLKETEPQQEVQDFDTIESSIIDSNDIKAETEHLEESCKYLEQLLKNIQSKFNGTTPPKALNKLEVTYQKHQRLLANPAKDYVELLEANALFSRLKELENVFKDFDVEFSKLSLEIKDL